MTQRRRLDAFLLDAARERGVEVREGVKVEIEPGNTVVVLRRAGQCRRARRALTARTGSRRRRSGSGRESSTASRTRATSSTRRFRSERYARRLVLELADIPGGYAWVFPKGDHANVGVGGWQSEGPEAPRAPEARLRGAWARSSTTLEALRGHRLPLRRPGTRIAAERALLVGDAAGLIDPVSGDGMYECFVSGRLAAAADARPARRDAPRPRAVRAEPSSAELAPSAPRLVEAQAGARPLAASVLAGRALEAPLGIDPRNARRRASRSEQAARPRARAAACARAPRARNAG